MGTILLRKFPSTFGSPEGSPQCQTTVITTGCSIRFLQPFFTASSFLVLLVTASHSSCPFGISEEIAFLNEVPLKPPFLSFVFSNS